MTYLSRTITQFLLAMVLCGTSLAQSGSDPTELPDNFATSVARDSKTAIMRLEKRCQAELSHWQRLEKKLARKAKSSGKMVMSTAAIDSTYNSWKTQLIRADCMLAPYSAGRDSVITAMKFLQDPRAKLALQSLEGFEQALAKSNQLQALLKKRRQIWQNALGGLKPVKELQALKKRAYYLREAVREYQQVLAHPEGIQQKTLQVLRKVHAFNDFMAKHSALAALFPAPEHLGTPAALAGLQTRAEVSQLVRKVSTGSGTEGSALLQLQVQAARKSMDMLKDKVNAAGGGNSEWEIPDFKVNQQRNKRFLERLEIGTNLQTGKPAILLPTTSHLGLSVGYRLNDQALIGIGSAYMLGWKGSLRSLSFSHQGVGLRSFFDYRLKGTIWVSAGAEMNYRSEFSRVAELKNHAAWQQSTLVGLSKKYSISKKFKGNAQLLWDVLSHRQVPRTQAVLFRLGYSLK